MKPDIGQPAEEGGQDVAKYWNMMCCCPESFVGKRLEAIGIVNRMRS